jgi:hypothetical protein
MDNFMNAFKNDYSASVNRAIQSYGQYCLVEKIIICRVPIVPAIEKIMNVLSSGKIKAQLNRLNYDSFFHLYVVVKLRGPEGQIKWMKCEKNQTINIEISNNQQDIGKDYHEFKMVKDDLTLDMFFYLVKKQMGSNFSSYNPVTNNCQVWVYNCCDVIFKYNYSGINLPDILVNYIRQRTEDIFKDQAFLKKFSSTITNLAGFFTRMFGGNLKTKFNYD